MKFYETNYGQVMHILAVKRNRVPDNESKRFGKHCKTSNESDAHRCGALVSYDTKNNLTDDPNTDLALSPGSKCYDDSS